MTVTKFNQDMINDFLKKIQSTQINNKSYLYVYYKNLIKQSYIFDKLKRYVFDMKKYKNQIIKVNKPTLPKYYKNYTVATFSCTSHNIDSDDYHHHDDDSDDHDGDDDDSDDHDGDDDDSDDHDDNQESTEIDISELLLDTYQLDLHHNTNTILNWVGKTTEVKNYALLYQNEPILYFNNKEKAVKYMRHIAIMIIEQLNVLNYPQQFRLQKITNGYKIQRCLWDILFSLHINVSTITLHPIFEI
jgi:hypothetical protein